MIKGKLKKVNSRFSDSIYNNTQDTNTKNNNILTKRNQKVVMFRLNSNKLNWNLILMIVVIINYVTLSKSQLAAEFLAKMTKISLISNIEITNSIFNSCRSNPMIDLLPSFLAEEIRNSMDNTLIDSTKLDSCSVKGQSSCCSQSTIDLFKTYINDIVIPNKSKIYEKNSKIYKLIINEHNRNYNAFEIDMTTFDSVFEEYSLFADNIAFSNNKIVKESITYQWNSFCNYICKPYSYMPQLCSIYNETISVNEKEYWTLKYNCKTPSNHTSYIESLISDFEMILSSNNSTLDKLYSQIKTNSANLGESKTIETSVSVSNSTSSSNSSQVNVQLFLNNSLSDGLYVSKSVSKMPICHEKIPSCSEIKKKICIPFYCFDDLFMQFIDDSTVYQVESLENSNYTVINIQNKDDTQYDDLFSYHNDDNLLTELLAEVGNTIRSNYIRISLFLLVCILIINF